MKTDSRHISSVLRLRWQASCCAALAATSLVYISSQTSGLATEQAATTKPPLTVNDLTAVIKKHPKDYRAFCERAAVYKNEGRISEAIDDFSQAIHLQPKNSCLHRCRGLAYLNAGSMEKAIADFDQAVTLSPKSHAEFWARATAYKELGEYAKAISDYSKAI